MPHATYSGLDWPYTLHPQRKRSWRLQPPEKSPGTEWLGRLAAQIREVAQATRTVTAQVADYVDTMTLADQYGTSRMQATDS